MAKHIPTEPTIDRSVTLHFVGDWGMANFHRICSFLTQQLRDRAGPRSRVAIWNMRGGGLLEGIKRVYDGEVDLCIATPAKLMETALTGRGFFAGTGPMPTLRTLAVLPQRDRMMLAIDPKWQIKSFEDLRQKKPPLRIATSVDDGTNFIGYVAMRLMEAHGISEEALTSWGGLHHGLVPIPAEKQAVSKLAAEQGVKPASIRAGFWDTVTKKIPVIDFSDFLIIVRDDMPEDIAHLLTWCLVQKSA
ncbi:hypothetical protein DL546_002933 [Coniochaeta pulveracea]|uniref:ABC transporter substrate-binding protein n=1 Tax=Coniochaeta pulveracea TaxID=177199 RepID=A0A420XZM6_9PEZI|nr:hypothetical protein DL546_002933 [Coniochaeta pulveracea]